MTNPQKEAFAKARAAATAYANALRGVECKFPGDVSVNVNINEALSLLERSRMYLAGAYDRIEANEWADGY